MNNDYLLAPALLEGTAFFIIALAVLMISAHTQLLALAARRTTLSPAVQFRVPLIAAALLAAWFGWAVLATSDRVVAPDPLPVAGQLQLPLGRLAGMAVFVAAGIAVLFWSRTMRMLNTAMPPAWLIGVQTYRVAGLIFLWPFLAHGALPAGFALPAGIGDALTGLLAPLVAWAVARNRPGARALAVGWNLFGMLDLMVAPAAAVLAQSTNVARFPLVIIPLFVGPPLGILTHIYSLRNLYATQGTRQVTGPANSENSAKGASMQVT